jgi:hypothetical protein
MHAERLVPGLKWTGHRVNSEYPMMHSGNRYLIGMVLGILALSHQPAAAQPDLTSSRQAGTLTVYADDRRPALYYYGPKELELAQLDNGKPDVHFLLMRYVGNAAAGDRGTIVYRSLLSLHVTLPTIRAEEIRAAKQALRTGGSDVELRPLPIRRLEAALIYTSVGTTEEPTTPEPLPKGHFQETENSSGTSSSDSYWTDRMYTLSLDPATAQMFWSSLQQGQVILSVGYAFIADGVAPPDVQVQLKGPKELTTELRRQIDESGVAPTPSTPLRSVVRAGAFSVSADAQKWPDLFVRADLNEHVPPGYASLDVYCYDFQQGETDLYEKRIEIDAESVNGRRMSLQTSFKWKQPDIYARTLRFPFAVRLDRPYRYRVVEMTRSGEMRQMPWVERTSWGQILDVTTPSLPPSDHNSDSPSEGKELGNKR